MSEKKLFIGINQKDIDAKKQKIEAEQRTKKEAKRIIEEKRETNTEKKKQRIADKKLLRSMISLPNVLAYQVKTFFALFILGSLSYMVYEYDNNGFYDRDLKWKNNLKTLSFDDNPYLRSFREAYTFKSALFSSEELKMIKNEGKDVGMCDCPPLVPSISCGKNFVPITKGIITYGTHLMVLLFSLYVLGNKKRLHFIKNIINGGVIDSESFPNEWKNICAKLEKTYPNLFQESIDGKIANEKIAQEIIYQHIKNKPEDIEILKNCFYEFSIPEKIMNIKKVQKYLGK